MHVRHQNRPMFLVRIVQKTAYVAWIQPNLMLSGAPVGMSSLYHPAQVELLKQVTRQHALSRFPVSQRSPQFLSRLTHARHQVFKHFSAYMCMYVCMCEGLSVNAWACIWIRALHRMICHGHETQGIFGLWHPAQTRISLGHL